MKGFNTNSLKRINCMVITTIRPSLDIQHFIGQLIIWVLFNSLTLSQQALKCPTLHKRR